MKEEQTFSRKNLTIVIATASISMIACFLIFIFEGDLNLFISAHANTYSRSAVGHQIYRDLLKNIGIPVSTSTFATGNKAATGGLLLMLEPTISKDNRRSMTFFRDMLEKSPKKLIAVPKWQVTDVDSDLDWVEEASPYSSSLLKQLFSEMGAEALYTTYRSGENVLWNSSFPYTPTIPSLQLLDGAGINPIISCEEGVFFGSVETPAYGTIYLLSDPDIIANYNIDQGENGSLAVALVNYLRDGGEGVIIDEMMHGIVYKKSVWRMLFDFPNIMLLISSLFAAGILFWGGMIRFGKAQSSDKKIEWGKGYLIDNSAHLLTTGNHESYILRKYFANVLYSVAQRAAISVELNDTNGLVAQLDKHYKSNKATLLHKEIGDIALADRIEVEQVVRLAQKVDLWRKEIMNGTA